jgi:hypothetical protein
MKIGRIYNFHGPFSKHLPKALPSGVVEEHEFNLGGTKVTRAGHVHFDTDNCNLCNKPLQGSSFMCKNGWTRWVQDNSGLITADKVVNDDGKYISAFVQEEGAPPQTCCFKCFEWNNKQDELMLDLTGCFLCKTPINKSRNVCQKGWKRTDHMITGLVMGNQKPVMLPRDGLTPFVCGGCSDHNTAKHYTKPKIKPKTNNLDARRDASRAAKAQFDAPCHLCNRPSELSKRLCQTGDHELVTDRLGMYMEAQTPIIIAEGEEHRVCEECFDRNSAKRIGRKQYQPGQAPRRARDKRVQKRIDLSGRGLSAAADAARRHK